jgi:hypothetical protein
VTSNGSGYAAADALCSKEYTGSVVCSNSEILESIRNGKLTAAPETAWIEPATLAKTDWAGKWLDPQWSLACCG